MLRGMLGFLQKEDKNTQTESNQEFNEKNVKYSNKNTKSNLHLAKYSNHSSTDNSKIINSKYAEYESQVTITSPMSSKNATMKCFDSNNQQNWASRGSKYLLNQPIKPGTNLDFSVSKKSERCASPGILKDKYKFVPSLPLN